MKKGLGQGWEGKVRVGRGRNFSDAANRGGQEGHVEGAKQQKKREAKCKAGQL